MTWERRYQVRIHRPRGISGAWMDVCAGGAKEAAGLYAYMLREGERLDVRCPASGEVWEDAPRTAP